MTARRVPREARVKGRFRLRDERMHWTRPAEARDFYAARVAEDYAAGIQVAPHLVYAFTVADRLHRHHLAVARQQVVTS